MNITSSCKHENCKCHSKVIKEYGGFCKKHRKDFLLKDNNIILDRFTINEKDYSLRELKSFFIRFIRSNEKITKYKKSDYYQHMIDYYSKHKYSNVNIQSLLKVQALIRKYIIKKQIHLRGLSVLHRGICNNEEDFYTYESRDEIEDLYYFSYKDTHGKYWCFDVRSLKKLIDMNYGNPYTTEPFPQEMLNRMNKLLKHLHDKKIPISIDTTIVSDRETQVKQKCVDLFSQIEMSGYSCDINWVLGLSINRIKKLYRELEDIWNYRSGLAQHIKCRIAPPSGRLFVMPVQDYLQCNVKIELLEILSNELSKILQAVTISDMNVGFMYFIMGLSIVNPLCLEVHPWVQFAI